MAADGADERRGDDDPTEFLRALLRISPEDAAKARANSPARRRRKPQEGPYHNYGDDSSEGNSQP
jgi:hypothetical protein